MTITLLDLYNTAATQEWAMYDNDATSKDEMEESLVLALNKAIEEIYTSFEFPFRERTHVTLTIPRVAEYDLPSGIIKNDKSGTPQIKFNSKLLEFRESLHSCCCACGEPESFCIQKGKIMLNPAPSEKGMLTIDYYTLAIGETVDDEEVFSLKNDTDKLLVPDYLEELMKNAVITRTMLNSIASESDENYSAYKKQADKAYRTLVKYAKGVNSDKVVII